MDLLYRAYLIDLGILLALLAIAGFAYLGLATLAARIVRDRRLASAFLRSLLMSIGPAVVCVTLYVGNTGLFRHTQVGDLQSALRSATEDHLTYISRARAAFFTLNGLLVVFAAAIGVLVGQRVGRGFTVGSMAVLGLLLFLLVTLPVVDSYNACVIGQPFILPASC